MGTHRHWQLPGAVAGVLELHPFRGWLKPTEEEKLTGNDGGLCALPPMLDPDRESLLLTQKREKEAVTLGEWAEAKMTWFDREVEVHMVETFFSDRRETDDENGAVCQEGSGPKLPWGARRCAVSVCGSRVGCVKMVLL